MKREEVVIQTAPKNSLAMFVRWHRALAWVAGIAVVVWGLSGVMHPIMSALSPKVQPLPPAAALPSNLMPTPLSALAQGRWSNTEHSVQSVRLLMLNQQAAWRVQEARVNGVLPAARWFAADSGAEIATAETQQAEKLARALTGDAKSEIRSMTRITEFGRDYPAINKLLPVWRVEFARDDGMLAFVDTEGSRLAALSDQTKHTLMGVFVLLHTWAWASEPIKLIGMSVMLGLTLLTMGAGLAMYVIRSRAKTLRSNQPLLRRVHRKMGLLFGIAGLCIASSGLIHLWFSRTPPAVLAPKALTSLPALHQIPAGVTSLTAVNVAGQALWLVQGAAKPVAGGEHAHHTAAPAAPNALPTYLNHHGQPVAGAAQQHAADLVRAMGVGMELEKAPIQSVELISKFAGEYGFFQKRLPVYRVSLANAAQSTWYIEPATGQFSTLVEQRDRLEGYSFAYLHKWHWLDGLGKDARDVILASFAAANVALAVMGLLLLRRRRA
ncbi:hypothetical protein [Deefgea rivuli]|uniref:hypothetical protein n=1 Tax=Deefgea rivuli TaxID=400948 RepID=UPI0004808611|nr:hypothetical protein [Deefgea rivuli]